MHFKGSLITVGFVLSQLATFDLVAALGPAPGSIKNLVTFGDSYTDIVSNQPNH